MSNEILDTNFHSRTCVAVCVRRYKEAQIGLINTTKLTWLKFNYRQGPKAGSTQQMPSLSVSISLFPNNLNGLQAGLADNAMSLSKLSPNICDIKYKSSNNEMLNIPGKNKPTKKVCY